MTPPTRYIHVRNWWARQRFDDRRPIWFRVYANELARDENFEQLTGHRRAVLLGIWIEYAQNIRRDADDRFTIARGLRDNTATLSRRLALRVTRADIESLNHAGFVVILEHETVARGDRKTPLEVEILREDLAGGESSTSSEGENGARAGSLELVEEKPKQAKRAPARARARDPIWDSLAVLFGVVADGTSAHGARNKAAADLRAHGATPELVRRAAMRWPTSFPSATLTDVALAKHYPALTLGMKPSVPPCSSCGLGGGSHLADCEQARAADGAALDLEGLEDYRPETEAA